MAKTRLIDADKLMKRFRIVAQSGGPVAYHVSDICATIEDEATEEPVDAVEVVHGEWIGIQYDGYADGCPVYDLWECSECREEYESEGDPPPYNYCPNCGAKMDGKDDT